MFSRALRCPPCAYKRKMELQQGYTAERARERAETKAARVKTCLDCPKDISDRHPFALRCSDCAYQKDLEHARENSKRRREGKARLCQTCSTDIRKLHGSRKYCDRCDPYTERRPKKDKRVCLDCDKDISKRPTQSFRCEPCQEAYELAVDRGYINPDNFKMRTCLGRNCRGNQKFLSCGPQERLCPVCRKSATIRNTKYDQRGESFAVHVE